MRIEWLLGILATTLLMVPSAYGQCEIYYGPPVVYMSPPPVYCPPATDYILNRYQSPSDPKTFRKVHYDNGSWINVPVINGYVPEVQYSGNKTIYDYRGRWLLSKVKYEGAKPPRVSESVTSTAPPPRVRETRSYDPPEVGIEETRTRSQPPRAAIEEYSEFDGKPWKSGLKKPADDGWRAAPPKAAVEEIPRMPTVPKEEDEKPLPPAPPKIDLSKSPYRTTPPPPPTGMRLPAKIEEPEKRIVPKYDEKK